MLKIGLDKTDKTFRKFEYDDERKYGNPLVYKVLYEETGDFGEILCSNVIAIKQSNNVKNHFLDIPKYGENKKVESKPEPKVTLSDDVNDLAKLLEEPVEKKKPKSSTKSKAKTKDKGVPLTGTPIEVKEFAIGLEPALPKSYEYDVIVIDNINHIEDIKSKLNEYGKDGWEVCGFQTVNKVISCQMIIILKKGLN
jgi:hypothetical protein